MADIRNKYVPPSLEETAFNCPHCGVLAKQFWYSTYVRALSTSETPPHYAEELDPEKLATIADEEKRESIRVWVEAMAKGRPFLGERKDVYPYATHNVSFSSCHNCPDLGVWIYDRLVWPHQSEAPLPNPDLPSDIREDYDEAGAILDLSPRGAAALLRLCVQKLCKHLGEKGKDINKDIGNLVKKGLDPVIKQALDVVRVTGNHAVHPGQMELKEDRATAEKLFGLVNLITQITISIPNQVKAQHDSLPAGALKQIEERDKKPS